MASMRMVPPTDVAPASKKKASPKIDGGPANFLKASTRRNYGASPTNFLNTAKKRSAGSAPSEPVSP